VIPNITRGGDVRGVLSYLVGKGRREEHKDPHLVAGSPEAQLLAGDRRLQSRDASVLARFLDEARQAFGTEVVIRERDQDGQVVGSREAHVWHCSLSLHPDEPELEDARWGEICDQLINELGFAGPGARATCRWVAIRHGRSHGGSDHAHLVVQLIAEDGTPARVHNDRPRAQQACRALEQRFGLHVVEARGRGAGERGIKQGEIAADRQRGRPVGEHGEHPERGSRQTLERVVRACASASGEEAEFVQRLRGEGLLIRPRYAKGNTSEVLGYSVALRLTDGQRPVWFGGGRLSRELTLPRLRESWPSGAQHDAWRPQRRPGARTTAPPSPQLEAQCANELASLRDALHHVPVDDWAVWAQVARETAGVFAAWSLRTEPMPGPLAATARSLARSAQLRTQPPARARVPLSPARNTARLMLAAGLRGRSSLLVLSQLANLSKAMHDMHLAAAQAERAAEIEHTVRAELAAVSKRVATSTRVASTFASPRRRGIGKSTPDLDR
jgi:hypothetical protein